MHVTCSQCMPHDLNTEHTPAPTPTPTPTPSHTHVDPKHALYQPYQSMHLTGVVTVCDVVGAGCGLNDQGQLGPGLPHNTVYSIDGAISTLVPLTLPFNTANDSHTYDQALPKGTGGCSGRVENGEALVLQDLVVGRGVTALIIRRPCEGVRSVTSLQKWVFGQFGQLVSVNVHRPACSGCSMALSDAGSSAMFERDA